MSNKIKPILNLECRREYTDYFVKASYFIELVWSLSKTYQISLNNITYLNSIINRDQKLWNLRTHYYSSRYSDTCMFSYLLKNV